MRQLDQTAAAELYEHIDNLELYVGLQAEEAKQPEAGVGLCSGFTTSRCILADVVSLTRGDRFLTFEFTRSSLFHVSQNSSDHVL
jgi:hypothetical protein